MNLEHYFISLLSSNRIGDDGAYIDGYVYSKDAFFENIHFKTKWMSYYQIAQKAMLVNISDAVAMNATPRYALLSIAMPKSMSKEDMRELVRGFESISREHGVEIIGGDTISNTKLDISITIISKTKKPLLRSGVRSGDILAYTGELGNSAKDLKKLLRLGNIHKKSKFVNIKLRTDFIKHSSHLLKAGMDISDGLFSDLEKIASLNRIGFKFTQEMSKLIGCSGEEYEMLVAFDKRNIKAMKRRAEKSRTKLNIFAIATRKKYTNRCKAHHF